MNATVQNPLHAPLFEVPDPTEEFGQDGGKFYRCYDALADEIDEDMVKGLKEQLDGMLIFAGLFAGVNTAFLALTLPLLSADPADDTNALLAQNNAILIQLVIGRNDSVPTNSALPSAGFSPTTNIFAVNALFSLSLAFAIISSFLAVLGRQWLVYYRKRSGGGPDRQRWEQLKRYLGAERWQLERILDDVLPSLLQIGLIIFCVSLVLYLHHLSPAISILVGIPLYIGLAFFIGSALCTVRDKFCPFHSPLSHMLFWSARKIPSAVGTVKGLKWDQIKTFSLKPLLDALTHDRVEESVESLQVIALQRAICTSDDPGTHISATANIVGITTVTQMEQLWSDKEFRERFIDHFRNSYSQGLQLRGQDQGNFPMAVQRLYCAAAAHCILLLDIEWQHLDDFMSAVRTVQETSVLVPSPQIPNSPACLIRSNLAFSILHFYTYFPSSEIITSFCNHLVICSSGHKHQDWKLLGVLSFIVSNLPGLRNIHSDSLDSFRRAYRGDTEHTAVTLRNAFDVLLGRESSSRPEFDHILISMLQYVGQMIAGDRTHMERKFTLLEICEPVLQSLRVPEGARQLARRIRFDLAQFWERECDVLAARAGNSNIPTRLFDMLNQYFQELRTTNRADLECDESVTLLRTFGPPTRKLFSHQPWDWEDPRAIREKRKEFRNMFNEFVMEVDTRSRRNQNHARRAGDPDERWCHWQEQSASVSNLYSLPPDDPYSAWELNFYF